MKFETVQIHFLSDVFGLFHPKILVPWQRDVTTSPLYYKLIKILKVKTIYKLAQEYVKT